MVFKRNPDFISQQLKKWMPRFKYLFNCEVTGVENFRSGQQLCVANHNIGVLIEGFTLLDAWENRFRGEHICFAMAHRFFFAFPGVNYVMRRLGCIPASLEASAEVFSQGHSVLVFPGGNYECIRTFFEREICDFKQRKGWIKIALACGVPITPISIVGSHSVNPVFYRSRVLSYLLILPILFRIKWFPISLSQIVYTSLTFLLTSFLFSPYIVAFLCYAIFMISFLVPVLPAKIKIHVHESLYLEKRDPQQRPSSVLAQDASFLQEGYDHVTQIIQKKMDQMNQKQIFKQS